MSKKTVDVVCTSAFMAGGKMILPKQEVKGVPYRDAMDLARRGKAKVVDSVDASDADTEAPDLSELSVDELKSVAEEHGIKGAASMKKADLIKAIADKEGV